jgi:hypothetical protein
MHEHRSSGARTTGGHNWFAQVHAARFEGSPDIWQALEAASWAVAPQQAGERHFQRTCKAVLLGWCSR